MPEPSIEILGVYRLTVTDGLLREQVKVLHGSDIERGKAEKQIREQLESAVLIELIVRNPDRTFSVDDFTQPRRFMSRGSWQAPWLEAFLTPDGEGISEDPIRYREPPKLDSFRIAFYLHEWNPKRPLRTSYGDIACPPPTGMPDRLQRLVPYESLD